MADQLTVNDSWHSYPSVYALGHRYLADLLLDPVTIEEKIDGSQFSFGFFEGNAAFTAGYRCRSKGAELNLLAPEKMFKAAVDAIQQLPLHPGWTYRGEMLCKPKHNALAYDRVPEKGVIVFDINTGNECYLQRAEKQAEAARIGLECVPVMHEGRLDDVGQLREMLDRVSILGGQKIEGVVVKNYSRFGQDKKVLMGKFVSEAFKEVHAAAWKAQNQTQNDIVQKIGELYTTPARWQKALQHLKELGGIEGSPRDIGLLIHEVWPDIEKECQEEIKQRLYDWASPALRRMVTRGLPEWYKQQLLEGQFNG